MTNGDKHLGLTCYITYNNINHFFLIFSAQLRPDQTTTKPSPCTITVLAGSNITIEAWSDCTRPGMTYNWTQKGRGTPSYQYQTSCDGKDGSYGNASTSLVFNNVQHSDAGEYHLSYMHKDIGPQTPPIVCFLNIECKYFYSKSSISLNKT